MSYQVSPLRAADAEVIGPGHNRVWRVAYRGLLPDEVFDARSDEDSTRRWRERGRQHDRTGQSVEGAITWVARDLTGAPVGWASAGPARDDDAPAELELWSLYLLPEHWGSGAARQLVEAALGERAAYLWVLQGNERALAFYRRQGFVEDGSTQELAGTGATELRMVRGVTPAWERPCGRSAST
ncbi:GNAT family N-acetyltransferase [Arsenicicoccus dermatophilus]|uniref:GNAT family N-acetyltransferase n=1 Tax=Arsenicicoccus dermatophilus TaxID=1076331 RepID=UPI001F4C799F|nr:GNAT family N-acetyltransferase [Arsenicicoccus dermatophilus]MCH8613984.1 GNAT family N-acetyltransferase [Arsenicicoccus dermatophilus]